MNTATPDTSTFETHPRDPRLTKLLEDYPGSVFSDRLYQSIELMECYSIQLAADLANRLGLIEPLQEWTSVEELRRLLSFQPRFSSALTWILQRLVETGCLEARNDANTRRYQLRHSPDSSGLDQVRTTGVDIDPANRSTFELLDHATGLYPAVARGEQTGEQGLFSSEGIALWLNYFSNTNLTYAVNNWVAAVVGANRVSNRSTLRILEIGAGAGSGTETLLHCLNERGLLPRIERYLVTEPNAFFRRRAQRELTRRYANLPMEWGALDLDVDWESQGIGKGQFDLIYAVNVLHISKDLVLSLNRARSALANDGWLVIGECLRPSVNQPMYPELMFQILESFTDVELDPNLRPNPGFLTAAQWRRLFLHAAFQNAQVLPDVDAIHEIYPHFFTGAVCGQNSSAGNEHS